VRTVAGGALAFAGTLCLWWLYFHAEPLALEQAESAGDPVDASRLGTNGLLFMIAGLIALAAGNALVIDHPSREATAAVALMLCGGPALFLAARAWYQRRVFAVAPRAQLLAIGVLVATAAAVRSAPALVAALAVVAVLAALVVFEHLRDAA
jgi:low temperature requirement protein LtrA